MTALATPDPDQYGLPRDPAAWFLHARASWLRAEVVRRPDGREDVALIVDGTYSVDAQRMAEHFNEWLVDIFTEHPDLFPAQLTRLVTRYPEQADQ